MIVTNRDKTVTSAATFDEHLIERLSQSSVAVEWLDTEGIRCQWSGQELLSHVARFVTRLEQSRLNPGDRVAVLADSSPASLALDLALFLAGYTSVPMHPDELSGNCQWYLRAIDPALVVVGDQNQAARLLSITSSSLFTVPIVALQEITLEDDRVICWPLEHASPAQFSLRSGSSHPVAAYPSESVGVLDSNVPTSEEAPECDVSEAPIKVILEVVSRESFEAAVMLLAQGTNIKTGERSAVVTPASVPLTRTAWYAALVCGASVVVCGRVGGSADTIRHQLSRLAPHSLVTHPRLLEQFHTAWAERASRAGGLPELLYKATLRSGTELTSSRQGSSRLEFAARLRFAVTRRFVGRRVRDQLGGSLERILLSSCVMTQYVARFYFGAGMLLQESIGTAATAGLSHLNPPDAYVYGTGVTALSGVETRVTDDGDIQIRGGHLPEPHDWLGTAFVGYLVGDKPVVLGRSAACIRVRGGKPVSADRLEARLTASPYIDRTVVVGHQRDFLSALIVLNPDSVSRWLREHGIIRHHASEMSRHPLVYGLIEAVVNEMNGALPSYETIRKFAILERDLSRELGELTASMELRRGMIESRHSLIVESFYREQY